VVVGGSFRLEEVLMVWTAKDEAQLLTAIAEWSAPEKVRSLYFRQVQERCIRRVNTLTDTALVVGLQWFAASPDPTKLGIRNDKDHAFVTGFLAAWVKYGGLTGGQRAVARKMILYGMIHIELVCDRFDREKMVEAAQLKGAGT
jgi:hypothetical protein